MITSNQLLPKDASKPGKDNAPAGGRSMPSRAIVHPKLEMTTPESEEEREANAVASDIVAGGKLARSISGGGQAGGIAVSSQMESQLGQLQGQGQPMPEALRGMMERGFGRDFSQVRLHTDGTAAEMSSIISAKAFTHGNDIYFGHGQYSPSTTEGQQLVAHELTHVAQGNGKVAREEDLSELTPEERQKKISSIASTQVNEISYSSSLFSPYVPENQSLVGQLMTPMTQVNGNEAIGDLSHLTPEERQKRIKRSKINQFATLCESSAEGLLKQVNESHGYMDFFDWDFEPDFIVFKINKIKEESLDIKEKSRHDDANLASLETEIEKEIKEIQKIQYIMAIHRNNNNKIADNHVKSVEMLVTALGIWLALRVPESKGIEAVVSSMSLAGLLASVEGFSSEIGNCLYGNPHLSLESVKQNVYGDALFSAYLETFAQLIGNGLEGTGLAALKSFKLIKKFTSPALTTLFDKLGLKDYLSVFGLSEDKGEVYEEMEYSEEYMKELLEWKKNH